MTIQEKILNQLQVLETLSKQGKLGDEIHFVERGVFYQMWYSLQEQLNLLFNKL